jgi:hypothetical protein
MRTIPRLGKTCDRCSGRFERVATLPKSAAAPGYDVYECLDAMALNGCRKISTADSSTTVRSFPIKINKSGTKFDVNRHSYTFGSAIGTSAI